MSRMITTIYKIQYRTNQKYLHWEDVNTHHTFRDAKEAYDKYTMSDNSAHFRMIKITTEVIT